VTIFLDGHTVDLQGKSNTAFFAEQVDNFKIYGGNIINGNLATSAGNTAQYYVSV